MVMVELGREVLVRLLRDGRSVGVDASFVLSGREVCVLVGWLSGFLSNASRVFV